MKARTNSNYPISLLYLIIRYLVVIYLILICLGCGKRRIVICDDRGCDYGYDLDCPVAVYQRMDGIDWPRNCYR